MDELAHATLSRDFRRPEGTAVRKQFSCWR